jgi:hypothetical protein
VLLKNGRPLAVDPQIDAGDMPAIGLLANDRQIDRIDFGEMPRSVEYRISQKERELLPGLSSMRTFVVNRPV